jgi:hypothetical protein
VLLSVPAVRRVGIPESGQEQVRSIPAEKSLVSGES